MGAALHPRPPAGVTATTRLNNTVRRQRSAAEVLLLDAMTASVKTDVIPEASAQRVPGNEYRCRDGENMMVIWAAAARQVPCERCLDQQSADLGKRQGQ